jgi:biopolymer transport protein ExbB
LFILALMAFFSISHGAKAWWDGDWSYRKKIVLDAGAKGAALPADAGRIPVLIRLHDGNFKFADAKDDGSDIRFIAGDDKTPLKFHLDTYDGLLGVALIWVDIPQVSVSQTTDVWMYWGNPKAVAGGDPKGTYDADTTLVYHFSETDTPPRDTTANGNNATTPAKIIDTGVIGRAAHLDGTAPIMLPTSPSLAILQNAQFSWSAWVRPETASTGVLFSKHDGQNGLVIGIGQGVPYVSVSAGAAPTRATAGGPITAAAWHHIAVTASDHVTLYVDGKQAATVAGGLPALGGASALGADTAPQAVASPSPATPPAPGVTPNANAPAPAAAAAAGFVGDIDEVEMAKTARSAGFVAAAFASQSPESHMLTYGEDEENSSMSGGILGVILRSVDGIAWAVIGFLGVMFAVAVIVMANKAIYISRAAKHDVAFLDIYTRYGTDIEELRVQMESVDDHSMDRSVLYRVYRAAEEELARRKERIGSDYLVLSPQAMATIRANLDRAAQQENEKMNSFLVLLTIAIAGGPFIGLLGTVIGVMITFAQIAAAGDVNVNAIAPGISAALVATVAGLGVAIPALFGYNYLTSRIKEILSRMRSFVDELVTRIGETYSGRPEKLAAE